MTFCFFAAPPPLKCFFFNSLDNSCSVSQPLNIALTWGKHSAKVRAQNVDRFNAQRWRLSPRTSTNFVDKTFLLTAFQRGEGIKKIYFF